MHSQARYGSGLVHLVGVEPDDVAGLVGHGGNVDGDVALDVVLSLDES